MHNATYQASLLRDMKQSNSGRAKLLVAWDYDQCLDKVLFGHYTAYLKPYIIRVMREFIEKVGVGEVTFCSYSSRVSNFYNLAVQPIKEGHADNLESLNMFAEALRPELHNAIEVNALCKFMLNGEEEFAQRFYEGQSNPLDLYKAHMQNPDPNFITQHKIIAGEVAMKEKLYKNITTFAENEQYNYVLFVDDKKENLDFVLSENIPCFVYQLHGTLFGNALRMGTEITGKIEECATKSGNHNVPPIDPA